MASGESQWDDRRKWTEVLVSFPVFALDVWREFLLCFIWTHFAVQLNLPIYRREDSAAAQPNTITPLGSLQNYGSCLAELLTSFAWLSNEVRNRTKLNLWRSWPSHGWTDRLVNICNPKSACASWTVARDPFHLNPPGIMVGPCSEKPAGGVLSVIN